MPEQVNIASLTINTDEVTKKSVELKTKLDALKVSQKELTKAGDTSSEAFVKNETAIKNLSKSYRDNQKFAAALESTNEDLIKTMSVEGKSTQELYDSRRELNQITNNIKGNTEEEIKLREELNVAIDNQTEALRDQQSEFNSGKDQIGEYTKGINDADFNLKSFIQNSEEAGGATELLKGGLGAAKQGMIAFTKSTLAFIATPVGVVLAVLVGTFLLIKNAMERSEETTYKVKEAFAAFEGIAKFLLKALEPLGTFLVDVLVKYFEVLGKVATKASGLLSKALDKLGFDKAAASVEEYTEKVTEAVKSSQELTRAELAYTKAQRESRKVQLLYQKDAEKLRQIRDDESKSVDEKMKANEDLGRLLAKQSKEEIAIAQKYVDLAKLRIKLDGETEENLNALAEAQTEVLDIEERIVGQTSEQLVNRNSLLKEAAEAEIALRDKILARYQKEAEDKKKLVDDAIEYEKEQLELYNEFEAEAEAELQKELQKELDNYRAAQLTDAENRIAIAELTANSETEILQAKLDREKEAEILAAEETGASVDLINQKYAENQIALDKYTQETKYQLYSDTFGGIADLLGENTIAGKAAAIAQAGINTYLGATEVLAAKSILPEPFGTIAKIANTGVIIGSGLASVGKITGISTKLASGGMVRGAGTGTSDSIPALLSNGESVNNAKSTSMFAPLYSYLNELGGGAAFASGGIAGTSASVSSFSIIDYDLLGLRISEANASLPSPVVSVEEINTVSSNVSAVENLASA